MIEGDIDFTGAVCRCEEQRRLFVTPLARDVARHSIRRRVQKAVDTPRIPRYGEPAAASSLNPAGDLTHASLCTHEATCGRNLPKKPRSPAQTDSAADGRVLGLYPDGWFELSCRFTVLTGCQLACVRACHVLCGHLPQVWAYGLLFLLRLSIRSRKITKT